MKSLKTLIRLMCFFFTLHTFAATDSLKVLTPEDFYNIVQRFHPLSKQATLLVERSKARLKASRGAFDPLLEAGAQNKEFASSNYYNYRNMNLTIPTWYGIDIKAGTEYSNGVYADPERTSGQLNYAGISVPLAKNLLTDKRRTALLQAKLFVKQSEQDQLLQLNDVLLEAMNAYWNWLVAWQQERMLSRMVEMNSRRFEFVRSSWKQGDRAAIDTTEAYAQVQVFVAQRTEAALRVANAWIDVSAYMWLPSGEPAPWTTNIIPDTLMTLKNIQADTIPPLTPLIQLANEQHPKLMQYQYQRNNFALEQKLKRQNILPDIKLQYNLLQQSNSNFPSLNNYKYGVSFALPLRLSEATGEWRDANLKLKETDYKIQWTKIQVENKIRQYHNELIQLQQQVTLNDGIVQGYQSLLKAEESRFVQGESSLFVINNRELKVLESRQKLIELQGKYFKAQTALKWASGELGGRLVIGQ